MNPRGKAPLRRCAVALRQLHADKTAPVPRHGARTERRVEQMVMNFRHWIHAANLSSRLGPYHPISALLSAESRHIIGQYGGTP
jgi:hypothetical protein